MGLIFPIQGEIVVEAAAHYYLVSARKRIGTALAELRFQKS